MNLFINVLEISFWMTIPITLLIIFKDRLLVRYTSRFNYLLYIFITLKMLFINKIYIYIPRYLNTRIYKVYSVKEYSSIDRANFAYKNISILYILFCIWISISMILIIYKVYYNYQFYKTSNLLKQSILDNKVIESLYKEKLKLKIKRELKVFKLDGTYSPMLIGLFNPIIIIPNKIYSANELDLIFRHELIHYKRRDNYLKVLIELVTIIHWFNPCAYILKKQFYEHCELSCDEMVIKNCTLDDIKLYSLLLLDTMRYKNQLNNNICGSQLNSNKSSKIKRRVNNMLINKGKKRGVVVGSIILSIGIISTVSFKAYATEYKNDNQYNETNIVSDLVKVVGVSGNVGYVKKSELYNESEPQDTLEAVEAYMKKKENLKQRTIPVYNQSGKSIIDEYIID